MLNIAQLLSSGAKEHPNRIAIASKKRALSYSELDRETACIANALIRRGVKKGDCVAMLLPNSCEWVIAWYAIQKAGAVAVPLHSRLHGKELADEVGAAQCSVLIFGSELEETVLSMLEFVSTITLKICVGNSSIADVVAWDSLYRQPNYHLPDVRIEDEDRSMILFTSGTTGKAKGVVRTQKMMALHAFTLALTNGGTSQYEVMMSTAPLYHAGGSQGLIKMAEMYGTYVTLDGIVPEDVVSMIEKYRVTQLQMLPPVTYERIYMNGAWKAHDCSSVREVCISAGKCTCEYTEHIFEMFPGCHLRPSWGSTETCSVTCMHLTQAELRRNPEKITAVGYLIPLNKLRIIDENGNDAEPGCAGEALVSSPMVARGYLRTKLTEKDMNHEDQWFHTGDIIRQDPVDGCCYFIDRKKDIIKSGGENIFALEIERVIQQHPAVQECAVVAVPDSKFDEAIGAAIVLTPGKTLSEKELVEFCKKDLPSFKKPRYMALLPNLPTNSVGKIQKNILREKADELFIPLFDTPS